MTFMKRLEETLIMGDLGVRATMDIIEDLKDKVKEQHIKEPIECKQLADRQHSENRWMSVRQHMNLKIVRVRCFGDRSKWCW